MNDPFLGPISKNGVEGYVNKVTSDFLEVLCECILSSNGK